MRPATAEAARSPGGPPARTSGANSACGNGTWTASAVRSHPRPDGPRRIGTRAPLAVRAVLLPARPAPLLLDRADCTAAVPREPVSDERERTGMLSDRVRRALDEGGARLGAAGAKRM